MRIDKLFDVIESSNIIKSYHYYYRYKKMIYYYKDQNLKKCPSKKGRIESHHILPSGIWREHKKEKNNMVNVPVRAHIILHYLLYKSLNHVSCIFSFNQMSRAGKLNSKLYATHRIDLARAVSLLNFGRIHTTEQRNRLSKANIGKNNYRNPETGEIKKFIINEEPAGWVPFQKGRIRTKQSKRKIGNKIKNRKWQYHTETGEARFDYELHPGFVYGYPKWLVEGRKHQFEEFKWAYCPSSGKVIRNIIENIPAGYILGRNYNNKGFEKINRSGLTKVLDVVKCEYVLIKNSLLGEYPERYVKHGMKIDDILVFEYKGKKLYAWSEVSSTFPELPNYSGSRKDPEQIMSYIVPKPHHNQTLERRNFSEKFNGKTLREIGLMVSNLIKEKK